MSTLAWAQGEPVAPAVVPPQADSAVAAGPGLRWTVPLALSGSLAYDLRSDHIEGERSTVYQLLSANLNAASYIYQPWFALVSGSLGVTGGWTQGGDRPGSDRDQFITGALRLNLFPRSRFPFTARYEVSDSRIDPALGGALNYRAHTVGLSQRFRPIDGGFEVVASYERLTQEGEEFGEDTQDALMADFTSRWRRHNFNANLSRNINRRRATDERTDFRNVVLRHGYTSGTDLTVENSVNWSHSDEELVGGDRTLELTQWSSIGIWRPTDRPYTVTASLRGFKLDTGESGFESDTITAALGAQYEVNQNLRLSANVTANHANGQTESNWLGTVGGAYQGDTRELGPFSHQWSAGLTASRAHAAGRADTTVSGQLGHGLSRTWRLEDGGTWAATLNQSGSVSHTRGGTEGVLDDPTLRALTHVFGLTRNQFGAGHNAFFRITASDARQFDGNRARLQILNLQLSGTHEIDRRRSWTGDFTLQRVFQRSRTVAEEPAPGLPVDPFEFDRQITHTVSGEIAYRQTYLFDVPRLTFTSRLRVSHDAQRSAQVQALVPQADRESGSWENRLDWQIGRLDASMGLRASKIEGVWRHSFNMRLLRSFGE